MYSRTTYLLQSRKLIRQRGDDEGGEGRRMREGREGERGRERVREEEERERGVGRY
jgi:hypothetical protein